MNGILAHSKFYQNNYNIVIANCLVKDKFKNILSFRRSIYWLNNGLEVVFEICFFIFSRANIEFEIREKSKVYKRN